MIEEIPSGRGRRIRRAVQPWTELPPLSSDERTMLSRWARNESARREATLVHKEALPASIEAADALIARLLRAGLAELDEAFTHGRWFVRYVSLIDLPRLQVALGIQSRAGRDVARQELAEVARALADATADIPSLHAAAEALRLARPPLEQFRARLQLLEALQRWRLDQRRGMRQDFALFARDHTKAINVQEWSWLERTLDLEALGVERFAGVLWLGGDVGLKFDEGLIDLRAASFLGLPHKSFAKLNGILPSPHRVWLIENRASFERQCAERQPGDLIVWLAGRPSLGWCESMKVILGRACMPVAISADADPAGVEIALSAGSVCEQAGCPWEPYAMEADRLANSRPLPLGTYDLMVLQRLQERSDLPPMLVALIAEMGRSGLKHEQEAWL